MSKVLDRFKNRSGSDRKPRTLVPARDRLGRGSQKPHPDPITGIVQGIDNAPYLAAGTVPLAATDRLPYGGKRGPGGRWLPDASPNPGGRPASVVALISELTNGGEELIQHALATMRGELEASVWDAKAGEPVLVGPSAKDQAEARAFLANRLWGKAPETVNLKAERANEPRRLPIENLSADQLAVLYAAVRGAQPAELPPSAAVIDGVSIPAGRDDPAERTGAVPSPAPEGPDGDQSR